MENLKIFIRRYSVSAIEIRCEKISFGDPQTNFIYQFRLDRCEEVLIRIREDGERKFSPLPRYLASAMFNRLRKFLISKKLIDPDSLKELQ